MLPALVPGLSYEGMAVSNGDMASALYTNVLKGRASGAEAERVKKDLLEYCKMDTLAMVKIHDYLEKIL